LDLFSLAQDGPTAGFLIEDDGLFLLLDVSATNIERRSFASSGEYGDGVNAAREPKGS
jgi:hypothetical protein